MSNLKGTTWKFNEVLSISSNLSASINSDDLFIIGDAVYTSLSTYIRSEESELNVMYSSGGTISGETAYKKSSSGVSSWFLDRVITFVDEPTNFSPDESTFITWFEANATQLGPSKLVETIGLELMYQDLRDRLAPKNNPEFSGAISLGRKEGSDSGTRSVALGNNVEASGYYSFATGMSTIAHGQMSFAEGYKTTANHTSAHAEGNYTIANGAYSHAEGDNTIAGYICSHTEGKYTIAYGDSQHVSGKYNVPSDMDNFPSWQSNKEYYVNDPCKNNGSYYLCETEHTSGSTFDDSKWIEFSTNNSYAEIVGNGTSISNRCNARALDWNGNEYLKGDLYVNCSFDSAYGSKVVTEADPVFTGSISLGRKANTTIGTGSIAVGINTEASGNYSFAEGYETAATKADSHAEGNGTVASGISSHAEGVQSVASAQGAHAEGMSTTASGLLGSHAEGSGTIAGGQASHAEGTKSIAFGNSQHVAGKYNIPSDMGNAPTWKINTDYNQGQPCKLDGHYYVCKTSHNSALAFESAYWSECGSNDSYIEIIGNGTSNSARSNARTLDWSGNEYLAGNLAIGGSSITIGNTTITEAQLQTLLSMLPANGNSF